jgi:hypothetical protein
MVNCKLLINENFNIKNFISLAINNSQLTINNWIAAILANAGI